MASKVVSSTTFKVQTQITPEAIEDLKAFHSIDAQSMLDEILENEILATVMDSGLKRKEIFKVGDDVHLREEIFQKFPDTPKMLGPEMIVVLEVYEVVSAGMQIVKLGRGSKEIGKLSGNFLEKTNQTRTDQLFEKYRGAVASTKYGV